MATASRVLGGLKAKRYGDMFETMFAANCTRLGIVTTRMPDGCKRVGGNRLIPVRTPWDWIMTHEGKTALIDTKTVDDKRFPAHMITPHQVKEMLEHERVGAVAGYVIWLRKTEQIIFAPALVLDALPRGASLDASSIGVGHLGSQYSFSLAELFSR